MGNGSCWRETCVPIRCGNEMSLLTNEFIGTLFCEIGRKVMAESQKVHGRGGIVTSTQTSLHTHITPLNTLSKGIPKLAPCSCSPGLRSFTTGNSGCVLLSWSKTGCVCCSPPMIKALFPLLDDWQPTQFHLLQAVCDSLKSQLLRGVSSASIVFVWRVAAPDVEQSHTHSGVC